MFLCAQYKNRELINITFAISTLPAFEVMVPAAFEKNPNLPYQNRAMVRLFCLLEEKNRALDNVNSLCFGSYFEKINDENNDIIE